jgi:hypothetical protein
VLELLRWRQLCVCWAGIYQVCLETVCFCLWAFADGKIENATARNSSLRYPPNSQNHLAISCVWGIAHRSVEARYPLPCTKRRVRRRGRE